jgi:hypothetical protein
VDVVAVEGTRSQVLTALARAGEAEASGDGESLFLGERGEAVLRHLTGMGNLFSGDKRLRRRVVKALARESKKYGRVRVTNLPSQATQAGSV